MSEPDSPDDPGTEAARHTLILFGIAVTAAIVALAVVVLGTGGDDVVERDESGPVRTIGPSTGTDLERHMVAAERELASVEGRRVAVVSFTSYTDEDGARRLLGLDAEDASVELVAWLVAVPGGAPDVTDDLEAFREAVTTDAEEQLAEIARLLPTVDDDDFAEFYEQELVRYQALLDRVAEPAVFGAVVVASGTELRALASEDDVRLVGVGHAAELAPGARIRGVRPEEVVIAGEPPLRPV